MLPQKLQNLIHELSYEQKRELIGVLRQHVKAEQQQRKLQRQQERAEKTSRVVVETLQLGPDVSNIPVRKTEQVLKQLIQAAQRELTMGA
jgi:hypothetical protein